ncbi:MFS transporter [Sphaerotilus mobilis]|uniref:Putative MFS family arabinose efflux permease n=1 Tax=Sphaerotilus mobilis TaxID=47994 RepID=A0A4V2EX42_9BURK|nr:MFS transporter [Sphaerotilus mobilis]RZS58180.1 putative MFS family arabinose efflux permease [Sphaerotilus mobilis]
MNSQLLLLAICQGLFLSTNVTLVAVNGLLGLSLAPSAFLATLPIAAYVAGGALATPLVARHQRAWGRRRTFQAGLLVGVGAAGLAAWAAWIGSFWLLTLATLINGYFNANASLYRFAAAELVEPSYKEKAISWVLAAGIIGAVVGPNLASATREALVVPFVGPYLALMVLAAAGIVVMQFIHFPTIAAPLAADGSVARGRPLREIARQPKFIVAIAACSMGYGVMNLLMSATPIAMSQCGLPFKDAALVLEWHVLGMFVPSFFTGNLIKRFGTVKILSAGLVLNVACVKVALSGVDLMHFLVALFVLGLGWNFLYIGGTALATECYRPEERTTAQAGLDFWVYVVMTLTAFGSGALVVKGGWQAMNAATLLPLLLLGAAILWLAKIRQTLDET